MGRGGRSFSGSSEYLYNHQYRITKIETTYRELITKHQIPFIICINPAIDTFVDRLDMFDFLNANNKKGFFYQDEDFGRNVTGILLNTYFNDYFYFPNEPAKNKLNEENTKVFEGISYKKN